MSRLVSQRCTQAFLQHQPIPPSSNVVAFLPPQQAFVLYDGDVCLGGALVGAPGKTLHEAGRPVPSALREAAA